VSEVHCKAADITSVLCKHVLNSFRSIVLNSRQFIVAQAEQTTLFFLSFRTAEKFSRVVTRYQLQHTALNDTTELRIAENRRLGSLRGQVNRNRRNRHLDRVYLTVAFRDRDVDDAFLLAVTTAIV
jgi:hypothetical protein